MGSEKFSLRWNDFESTISSSLSEIREAEEFLDVTLACGEDQIQAHRLIISACSPLLRNIVRRTGAQGNPFIYLKGIKFEDLLACLQFMYQGEVSVAQENLNSFLSAAEELKVRGLTQDARKEDKPPTAGCHKPIKSNKKSELNVPQDIKAELRYPQEARSGTVMTEYLESEDYQADDYTDYNDDLDYQLETTNHSPSLTKGMIMVYSTPSRRFINCIAGGSNMSVEDLGQYVLSDVNVKEYHCGLCDTFRAKLPSKVRNHLEAIHFPGLFIYTCNICEKTLKGRNALNIHKSTMHSRKAHVSL